MEIYSEWEDWKVEAYEKIVTKEAKEAFRKYGYDI